MQWCAHGPKQHITARNSFSGKGLCTIAIPEKELIEGTVFDTKSHYESNRRNPVISKHEANALCVDSETKAMMSTLVHEHIDKSIPSEEKKACVESDAETQVVSRTRSPDRMKHLSVMCSQLRKPQAGFREVLRFCPQNTSQLGFPLPEPAAPCLEPSRAASYWVVGVK